MAAALVAKRLLLVEPLVAPVALVVLLLPSARLRSAVVVVVERLRPLLPTLPAVAVQAPMVVAVVVVVRLALLVEPVLLRLPLAPVAKAATVLPSLLRGDY